MRVEGEGEGLPCEEIEEIVSGPCEDERDGWACFSFRAPDPVLVWFPADERFELEWSTTVEAIRPPCAESQVTKEMWEGREQRARRRLPD